MKGNQTDSTSLMTLVLAHQACPEKRGW